MTKQENASMDCIGSSMDEVVDSYKIYLEVKYPSHLSQLKEREKSNLDGVRLEAAMFSIFRNWYSLNPKIGEVIGNEGGVDFICEGDTYKLAVEVTHLDTESIEQKSGISNTPTNGDARFFSMTTNLLLRKAVDKAAQVAGYPMPRILCIGATHSAATILLGKLGAQWLLTSETKFSIPVGKANAKSSLITDLEMSAFFKPGDDRKIIPCRQSISAILLVTMDRTSCLMVGLLHPQPTYALDISCLPDIPFLRVSNWPCLDGKILTEWIIQSPSEKRAYLDKITLNTKELTIIKYEN